MKILVVDDEKLLVKGLKYNLEQEGYQVETAFDGEEAVRLAHDESINLILLDIMLPKMDGLSVCRAIRGFSNVPIIMLSAKSEDIDKILGLEYGADDYITKPFDILELVERVKAVLRRTKADADAFEFDGIRVEFDNRRVFKDGEEIMLKPREFDLLEVLINNRNLALSREKLLNLVWEFDYEGDTRTVDVHIQRLRQKLGIADRIQTVYKTGYRFEI